MPGWSSIVCRSASMKKVVADLGRAASSPYAVMLRGEKGTGKTLLAELIHTNSDRAGGQFVQENCANIPPEMAESILFGHKRGSFTGAAEDRPGLFHAAHGGTLFLDEVADLPGTVQPKLLVAIEKGRVRRLGARQDETVNVRFIAATNRDLEGAQADGRFRGDLLDRLNVITALVPPLRDRREDITPLAQSLYAEEIRVRNDFNASMPSELPSAVIGALVSHSWPGNVRELRNVIRRLITFCADGQMSDADVRLVIEAPRPPILPAPVPLTSAAGKQIPSGFNLAAYQERERDEYVDAAMAMASGNVAEAARSLGVSRQALHKALERRGTKKRR